jgi:cytochrome c oxidase subunit 2
MWLSNVLIECMLEGHRFIMVMEMGIGAALMMVAAIMWKDAQLGMDHNVLGLPWVEAAWTLWPAVFVILLVWRALVCLYIIDGEGLAVDAFGVIGQQWFWSYQAAGSGWQDAGLVPPDGLLMGELRQLQTDWSLVVAGGLEYKLWVTAVDVIHSWTVHAWGAKIDAVPGRVHQIHVRCDLAGRYYGQCSEICGARHGFMPITVWVV